MDTAALLAALPAFCSTDKYRPQLQRPFTVTIDGRVRSVGTDGVMALVVDDGDFAVLSPTVTGTLTTLLSALAKSPRTVVQLAELRGWAGSADRSPVVCPDCKGSLKAKCDTCSGTGVHECSKCEEEHDCGHCSASGTVDCECNAGKVAPTPRPCRILGLLVDQARLAALLAPHSDEQVEIAVAGDTLCICGDGWTAILMRMLDGGEKHPTWGEVAS